MPLSILKGCRVSLGNQQVTLKPSEAFRAAERLIRSATAEMIRQEVDAAEERPLPSDERGLHPMSRPARH